MAGALNLSNRVPGGLGREKVKIDQREESTVVTCNYPLPLGKVYLKQRTVQSKRFDQLCTMVG